MICNLTNICKIDVFFCYHMCICVVVALIQELISFGCQMKRKIMKLADHKEEKKIQLYLR